MNLFYDYLLGQFMYTLAFYQAGGFQLNLEAINNWNIDKRVALR